MNHYATLECHRQSSPDEIKKAFRLIVAVTHPDVSTSDPERYAEACKAWRALNTLDTRRAYDRYLDAVGATCTMCDGAGALRVQKSLTDVEFSACPQCEGAGVLLPEGVQ